jgi:hypothetical protein
MFADLYNRRAKAERMLKSPRKAFGINLAQNRMFLMLRLKTISFQLSGWDTGVALQTPTDS